MSSDNVLKLIKEQDVKFVDLRFCDTIGKEQHVTVPASVVDKEMLKEGKMFDGSSIAGWKSINESDMILMPETESAIIDPFFDEATLNIRCDILEPSTMKGYERDPRSISKRAEDYLKSTGIADEAYFGPEPEFLSLMRYVGEMHYTQDFMKLILKKDVGTAIVSMKIKILVTDPVLKADIFQFRL